MSDWRRRLKRLEGELSKEDPRPKLSAYHDRPYAIFQYLPESELDLRREIRLMRSRLESKAAKRVTLISMADCLNRAVEASDYGWKDLFGAESEMGLQVTVKTLHEIIDTYQPLERHLISLFPDDPDPLKDVNIIYRVGAIYPLYRVSSLFNQLQGKVLTPTVLLYPGDQEGGKGLRFMGILDAEHNYRAEIF